ncbi:MAG TPA: hypothetical protein DEA38_10730 [Stenotrophomonas sp.]|nr:hypothetical protein [Stenotrophomonas sp.]
MHDDQPVHRPEKRNSGVLHRFAKAYGKAREWHCSRLRASLVGVRFAVWGDSGRFTSHGGWRISRISRSDWDA